MVYAEDLDRLIEIDSAIDQLIDHELESIEIREPLVGARGEPLQRIGDAMGFRSLVCGCVADLLTAVVDFLGDSRDLFALCALSLGRFLHVDRERLDLLNARPDPLGRLALFLGGAPQFACDLRSLPGLFRHNVEFTPSIGD